MSAAVFKTITETDDTSFLFSQLTENLIDSLCFHRTIGIFIRRDVVLVFDEVSDMAVLFFADRLFKRKRIECNLLNITNLARRQCSAKLLRDFFCCRITIIFLNEFSGSSCNLVDGFDHVNRNTDGSCLIGQSSCDGLTDPPCGISGELKSSGIVEFIDSLHQAEVAFLNKVKEVHTAVYIMLCNRDDKLQIALNELIFCILVML